jgi:hypothetical protein
MDWFVALNPIVQIIAIIATTIVVIWAMLLLSDR